MVLNIHTKKVSNIVQPSRCCCCCCWFWNKNHFATITLGQHMGFKETTTNNKINKINKSFDQQKPNKNKPMRLPWIAQWMMLPQITGWFLSWSFGDSQGWRSQPTAAPLAPAEGHPQPRLAIDTWAIRGPKPSSLARKYWSTVPVLMDVRVYSCVICACMHACFIVRTKFMHECKWCIKYASDYMRHHSM